MAIPTRFLDFLLLTEAEAADASFSANQVLNEPPRAKIPYNKMNLHKNEGFHNILAVLKKATKEEIDYWSNWYQYAHQHVTELAGKYDIPDPVAAAVCAVLSPNLSWKWNLISATRVMDTWMAKGGATGYKAWDKFPAYKNNVNKAMKILATGDVSYVTGPKVSVFYSSLLNPEQLERDLVLDGHAINVWRGIKVGLKNMKGPNKEERAAIIQDYRKVADVVGLTPQGVQAVTWFIWKAVKNPPKVKGKFKVEQPAVKEARRRLGKLIREMTLKSLGLLTR